MFKTEVLKVGDLIAPPSFEVTSSHLRLGKRLAKTFFIFSYPRYLNAAWLSQIINLSYPLDISLHMYPMETGTVLKQLRKRVTEIKVELMEREEKGLLRDPSLETAYRDMEELRDRLTTAQERMFKLGIYITAYADKEEELKTIENTLRSILEAKLLYIKPALFQQKEGFTSTLPLASDKIQVNTMMNTEPLSSSFPFISFDLSSNDGILYGVNRHNNSLILFDRFSLENANMTIFGTTGSGKSYAMKLDILRSLMLGEDVIVIDPENEYRFLSDAVAGSFFDVSLASNSHINPFDLPEPREGERPQDVLRSNVINLVGLMRIMLGGLSSEEDSIMDRAIMETYAAKDITPESDPATWKDNIPLMSDLQTVLEGMDGAESLVKRLDKFTKGTFANFFNKHTNVSMDNQLTVFGIRDMEDSLRPIATFIVTRYIWNQVRSNLKKRILVIDEAWWMMQNEDSASFLFGIVKRARKYWLGVTTITQDVNDFMSSTYGQPIITNSALKLIMKQSPATIDTLQKSFNLTEDEKFLLLECEVGEGLFFAGRKHVALKVIASYTEDQIITTAPEEVAKIKEAKQRFTEDGEPSPGKDLAY